MPTPPAPTPSPTGGEVGPPPQRRAGDLLRRLHSALEDRYRVERELDRGGMGTVFLARDLRHDRPVALKVLHPELAHALGVERFLREIRTAGQLSHPHILPLYDSGEADGLLFFTMPLVEGESLRARIRREGRLPLPDALKIAEEIADALACAHSQGVLHRDIKPENILLSHGSHAVLADFGLARAVHSAANRRITPTGLAIGSPLYMSPEQAAGVKEPDGRSDLYSLGCVLYEMLSGEPPFTGPSPQAVVKRKISETPPPLRSLRPEAPPAVERIAARAMERLPEDRFRDAEEMREALRAVEPARRWPAWQRAAVGAAAVLALLLSVYLGIELYRANTLIGAGALDPAQPILLADFQPSAAEDTAIASMAGLLLRTDLSQSRLIKLVPEGRLQDALRRTQRSPGARLDHGLARELAVREGIPAVILPRVVAAGSRYVLIAEVATPDSLLAAVEEIASDSADLISAVDRLSNALRQRIGETLADLRRTEPLAQVTTASLPALERYTRAVRAIDVQGDYPQGIALLEEAIALDPSFAMAHRKLGTALGNQGWEWERAIEALRTAYEGRARLPEREQYLTAGDYYDAIGEEERAITAYRMLLDRHPDDYFTLNNLGHLYSERGDYRRAAEHYARAAESNPSSALPLSNLAEALFNAGNEAGARETLERLRRVFPDYPTGRWNESHFAAARGDYAAAAALARELREAERDDPSWRIATTWFLGSLAALQGRLSEAEPLLESAAREELEHATPTEYITSQVAIGDLQLRLAGDTAAALARVERVLARHPFAEIAYFDRPYTAVAGFFAAAGRPERARSLLAEMEAGSRPPFRRLVEGDAERIRAAIALSEGEAEAAIRHLRAAVLPDCPVCGLPQLAEAYERLGLPDSAVAAAERYLATPYSRRVYLDRKWLASVHERLARLHEGRGDRERAAHHHRSLVRLWREADPELQPRVEAARRRLQLLSLPDAPASEPPVPAPPR